MKRLVLMRHGKTLFNEKSMIQGWCDAPLTEKGIEQVKAAVDYAGPLAEAADHLYSSTSERACDTLELITDRPYKRLKGLKECCYGIFEGENQHIGITPLQWQINEAKNMYESREAGYERFEKTVRDLIEKDDHHNVFVMSHGDVMYHFASRQKGNPDGDRSEFPVNAAVLVFDYDPETKEFEWTHYYNPKHD